ncbi:MAG: OmpH family outer membrane protein [Sphingobacteriaceae bacterium]|nr:OmpH family outer membrane protein [Sphingobacteriaceae bacterium]
MKTFVKVAVVAVGLFFTGSAVNAQQKFAHINSAALLEVMPDVKQADAKFQTFQKAKQGEIELMQAEYQKKLTVAQEKEKTLSEANKVVVGKELEAMGKELQDLGKRISDTGEKAKQELAQKQDELYQPIFKKAGDAVNAVAKEKGYAYVFDVSQPGVVFFEGGDDILALVKTKLGITATAAPATAKK